MWTNDQIPGAVADDRELARADRLDMLAAFDKRRARPVEAAVAERDPLDRLGTDDGLLEVTDRRHGLRREPYVGQWLPEPLLTDASAPDAAAHAETADSILDGVSRLAGEPHAGRARGVPAPRAV
jgi:hypothetical protein